MELRQLEYFMTVCKELHFTRAAEKLNIAQPTLSQQIKSLENRVDTPLFDRIGKRIALTEAGKILLEHSERVFYEIEQAELALKDLNGLERGVLTIGSLLTSINYLITPAILKFKHLYPNIELSVLGLRTGDIKKKLLENKLDLGIGFLPVKDEDLETIPLLTEELSLITPLDHPLSHVNEVDMRTLGDTSTILLPKNYHLRQLIDTYFTEIDMTLEPTLEITPIESIIQMVTEGIGVTILPAPYVDALNSNKLVKAKLVHPTPKREIGFIYRKNKFMCTATKSFISQVTEISKKFK